MPTSKSLLTGLLDIASANVDKLTPRDKRELTRVLASDAPDWLNALLRNPQTAAVPQRFSDNPIVQQVAPFVYRITDLEQNPFLQRFVRDNYNTLYPHEYLSLFHGNRSPATNFYDFLDPNANRHRAGVFLTSDKTDAENWARRIYDEPDYGSGDTIGDLYNVAAKIERPLILEPAADMYYWDNLTSARISPQSHPDAFREFVQASGYNPNSPNPWAVADDVITAGDPVRYTTTDDLSSYAFNNLKSPDAIVYRGIRDISSDAGTVVTTRYPHQLKNVAEPERFFGDAYIENTWNVPRKFADVFTWENNAPKSWGPKIDEILSSYKGKEQAERLEELHRQFINKYLERRHASLNPETQRNLYTFDDSVRGMYRAAPPIAVAGATAAALAPGEAQAATWAPPDEPGVASPAWYADPVELITGGIAAMPLRMLAPVARTVGTGVGAFTDMMLDAASEATPGYYPEEYYDLPQ